VHEQVLRFWFEEIDPKTWWRADPAFDASLAARYLPLLQQAMCGELFGWRATARGRLAEILVLDQFSRNVFRNTPRAFAQDPMALALAQEAVAAGAPAELAAVECGFLLTPYMHSESRLIHADAQRLFERFAPGDPYDFELKHKAIVDRFGRYPHRNAILGRVSTPEEEAFLREPGSSF
jgi:uncharacterized protein (DUF924 family)